MSKSPTALKAQILELIRQYSREIHRPSLPASENEPVFTPGVTVIPYAGRVFDENEVVAAISSTLDFWLTLGPEGEAFEAELAAKLGVRHSLLVNSGSSANLVALAALTTHKLPRHKRILPGDEVITVAAGFPTTVTPIVQLGAIPVFIDADPITGNARVDQLEAAYSAGKTKAVMMAHMLGNPFDLATTLRFCRKYDLWLIEDNCDALGSIYSMPINIAAELGITANSPGIASDGASIVRYTGTWGDLSTQSFYPPHHITMGEGGAVNIISKAALKNYAESFRDWGRDCWCPSGKDNTCNRRFDWTLGDLPQGYDHKYIYSHLGYNLKPLDPQAAIGREQLKKLPQFVSARQSNWAFFREHLDPLREYFDFTLPTHATSWSGRFCWDASGCKTVPSWFGFMIRVKDNSPFSRRDLACYLDSRKIGNRMLFGGNLVRQPAFVELKRTRPASYRTVDDLRGADILMEQAIFIGTYPGLTSCMLNYIVEQLSSFVKTSSPKR